VGGRETRLPGTRPFSGGAAPKGGAGSGVSLRGNDRVADCRLRYLFRQQANSLCLVSGSAARGRRKGVRTRRNGVSVHARRIDLAAISLLGMAQRIDASKFP